MIKIDINKYKKVPHKNRNYCMICEEKMGAAVINLPRFPMTEIYTSLRIKDRVALLDQSFHLCAKCGHGQLSRVIDIDLQYGNTATYNFRTSTSATGRESADFFIQFIKKTTRRKSLGKVVEIGCNDMYLLQQLQAHAEKLIGIDPVLKGVEKKYSNGKLKAIGNFFENVSFSESFNTVICKDTLEHIEKPKEFTRKIVELGNKDTIYFFYFPFLETLLQNYRFDQIFHQHLNYFSLKSIIYMLDELGCNLIDWGINYGHWGCIMFAFKKGKNTGKFQKDVRTFTPKEITKRFSVFKNNMENIQAQLDVLEKDGETIYGYGAAHMLPVLSYHLRNDFSGFESILDDDPGKDGHYYINLPVKIRHLKHAKDLDKSSVLVTAISSIGNTRAILAKLSDMNPRRIIIPLNTF